MHIGIAGCGLMGRLLAWQCHQLGHSVTLFDRDLSGQQSAAFAAAGMLAPIAEAVVADTLILKLAFRSMSLWPKLIETIDPSILFQEIGSILTSHAHDISELAHFMQQVATKIKPDLIKLLTQQEIAQCEPELKLNHAYHLTCEGQLDTRHFIRAVNHYIKQHNITCHQCTVTSVIPRTIISNQKKHQFDWVFDCRGSGGVEHFSDLRTVRGEIIHVIAPDVTLHHVIRFMHPRYPLYIVPLTQQRYIIGATEIDADDDSPISVRSCLELLNAAVSIHSGFAEARVVEMRTALRPALMDNAPRIVHEQGLIAINGLYRHGFLIAPALLEQCMQLLQKEHHLNPYSNLLEESHCGY